MPIRAIARALAGALALCALACSPAVPTGQRPTVSILAVGDTGRPYKPYRPAQIQRAVGLGLAAEDRREPVQALVLLGDNFYFTGLSADSIAKRVRDNVTEPYCRFVARDAPRFGEVEGGCAPAVARTPIVPIFAVFGNHDTGSDESMRLEREGLRPFVSNWDLPSEAVAVRELPGGVSLVLVDSNLLRDGQGEAELVDALRRARGPWRVIAAHHPVAAALGDAIAGHPIERGYTELVGRAIAAAGVPVQVFLSGHVHNLQLLEMPGMATLHAVAGAGSAPNRIRGTTAQRRFALGNTPGFARVDLVGEGDAARLVVSLFRTSRYTWFAHGAPTLVARGSVDVAGRIDATRANAAGRIASESPGGG